MGFTSGETAKDLSRGAVILCWRGRRKLLGGEYIFLPRTRNGKTNYHPNSSITLIECVTNFLNWSGTSIPQVLKAVTATPAAMLGLQGVKGCLESDADADLCVLSEEVDGEGLRKLVVDQVWKFGGCVYERGV